MTRVQRERLPGESRRTRRKPQPAPATASLGMDEAPAAEAAPVPSLRDPQHAERLERMRQWGLAEHARQQAEFERQAEEAMAQRQATEAQAQRSASSPSAAGMQRVLRPRSAGEPLSISWLAPETLLLLELGEPLTYVRAAA